MRDARIVVIHIYELRNIDMYISHPPKKTHPVVFKHEKQSPDEMIPPVPKRPKGM